MAFTASVTSGVLSLIGTSSGSVVVTCDAERRATVTDAGVVVSVTGGDQPVVVIDPTGFYPAGDLAVQGSPVDDVLSVVALNDDDRLVIFGGSGHDSLTILDNKGDTSTNDVIATGIEVLTGSTGDDSVSLGNGGNTITILGGVETLFGGIGIDRITLSDGDDTLITVRIDTLDAGAGYDTISFGALGGTYTLLNTEVVIGGSGADSFTLVGGATNVSAGAGADTVVGTAQNDSIRGGADVDSLTGGGGQDLFSGLASELSGDIITDLEDGESIIVTDATAGSMTAALVGSRLFIDPDGWAGAAAMVEMNIGSAAVSRFSIEGQTITFYTDAVAPTVSARVSGPLTVGVANTVTFTFSEAVQGFSLADVSATNGSFSNLVQVDPTTYTATFIPSVEGAATISIGAGSYEDLSKVTGSGTSLVASVVAGSPVLNQTGSIGADQIRGTAWGDTLSGLSDNDTVTGGEGHDTILGGWGNDAITGDLGDDALWGEAGADALDGGWGNDQLWGGTENDILYGGLGNDWVKGESGNDLLKGNDGNDALWGGAGNDSLTGGDGKDTFVFDLKPHKSTNRDKIVEFDTAADTIWLDNKAFTKLGKGAETKPLKLNKAFFITGEKAKDKNDYLIWSKTKGVLYYDADGSGSKYKPIEVAALKKGLALTYHDFFVI
jgi:Ca2+-binding RTX toxin-like protein